MNVNMNMASPNQSIQQLEQQRLQLVQVLTQVQEELLGSSRALSNLAQTCRRTTRSLPTASSHSFVTNFPLNDDSTVTLGPDGEEQASEAGLSGGGHTLGARQSHALAQPFGGGPASARLGSYGSDQVLSNSHPETSSSGFMIQNPSDACMDILTHEGVVRQTMVNEALREAVERQSLDQLVVKMFRSIASIEKWKMMAHFCNVTNGWNKLGPITRWRIEPTVENYLKLPLCYRPTELQLTVPHWPIIDWNPFPRVRDALIKNRELYDLTDVGAHLNFSFCLEREVSQQQSPFADMLHMNIDTDDGDLQGGGQFTPFQDLFNQTPPGDALSTDAMQDASTTFLPHKSTTKKVYIMVQEYVDYQKYRTDHPDQTPPRVDEEAVGQLLLAFRQRENAFKLHPDFFQRFSSLYNEFDVVRGQPRSIYLNGRV